MKVEGVEYDLVMLDEFEYSIEFPPRFSGKDEYKISVLDFSRFIPIVFTRKFHRLPKAFQRAVLLMNIRYEAGELREFGGNDFGFFWGVKRNGEWTEVEESLKEATGQPPRYPPIKYTQHGPSFYLTFKTGKYPKSSYTKMYPTKKEYEQMKKEQRNEKV